MDSRDEHLVAQAAGPSRVTSSRLVRVATWNLWWRFGSWRERATAIRAVLREARPDICALQEVWATPRRNFAAQLADELEMHWVWLRSPRPDRWHARVAGSSADVGHAILARWPIRERLELPCPLAVLMAPVGTRCRV
ncbi:MAG TPA: endonuclease/exonuclease/phosphatase family protein [Thermoleophilaceae bacterium]